MSIRLLILAKNIFYMRSLVVYESSVNIEYRTRNFEPMKEKIPIVSLLNSIFCCSKVFHRLIYFMIL
jgi:hypothetical protein